MYVNPCFNQGILIRHKCYIVKCDLGFHSDTIHRNVRIVKVSALYTSLCIIKVKYTDMIHAFRLLTENISDIHASG